VGGHVTLADRCTFDPTIGWADDIVDTLTFPRLDAIAERAWTGQIVGGPDGLTDRSAGLPRFTNGG